VRILIGGYLPAEGRFSMARTARTLHQYLQPLLVEGDGASLDEAAGAELAPQLNYSSFSLKIEKRLRTPLRLRTADYDVLHLVDNDYAFGIPETRLPRTVVTCHDLMPFLLHDGDYHQAFRGRFGRWCYGRTLKALPRCARVVCVSDFTKRCLLEYGVCGPGNLTVIHQAVDRVFRPAEDDDAAVVAFRKEHDLARKRVILHVGSCDPYKNVDAVLRVFGRLLRESGEDLVLMKIGGTFSADQQALVEQLGLHAHLRTTTGLDDAALVAAYNAADLLLWPSQFEGFGFPVLEAMACGTPVVCSNGGSLPEVSGDAAAVHDWQDEDGLFASCQRILEEPAYAAQLRQQGFERAAQFTWEREAAAYYRVYREVYAGK